MSVVRFRPWPPSSSSIFLIPIVLTQLKLGMSAHAKGDIDNAKLLYEKVLALDPENILANGWLGTIEAQEKNLEKARVLLSKAVARSDDPDLLLNYANVLQELDQHNMALPVYARLLGIKREKVLLSNLAACCNKLGDFDGALDYADQALEIDINYAAALTNRANALRGLKRLDDAVENYQQVIKLQPNHADGLNNLGVVLRDLGRPEEALAWLEHSIKLKPDNSEAWSNRGETLLDLKRHDEALRSFKTAVSINSAADYVLGDLLYTQMSVCDWAELEKNRENLIKRVLAGARASTPFVVMGLSDTPQLQKKSAEIYADAKLLWGSTTRSEAKRTRARRIRLGYFSMDFREHPVAHLIAELIELHDRDRFEVLGFSFGIRTDDFMRRRLENSFDKFLDLRNSTEVEIAHISRDLEVDIAIDLGGYTKNSRPLIFAHRAAPIQINYLGFPGTMGTDYMDYIIADSALIPEGLKNAYVESIIYLPNSYQANDSKKNLSDRKFIKEELGLPKTGFVFCCFNNNWKMLPDTFQAWVSIVRSVPNSVLWLFEDNSTAVRNLSFEAERHGLDPNRLIFAKRMPHSDHLARYRLADLFLDTFPYGAHTTASDALWAGVPVLTRSGQSFASRVASSLLHAVGLPELITHNAKEYESMAIELANDPDRLKSLKTKLAQNRTTHPLFNTALFTKHIESAYQAAYDRYHDGFQPDHIYVSP